VALRFHTKKLAACAALLVTFIYMLLSGATVSSRRSFLMTGLVLLAMLTDRLSLSARSLAWAALAIMVWNPEAATGSSFQMSFAAVAGLVAFYETFRSRIAGWYSHAGFVRRMGLHVVAIVLTTVISTLATTAFTIYHFNRLAVYSVAANVIAVPITGLWVLPWAMAAFGLERIALIPMGWGIDTIAAIAHAVTRWPGAAFNVPAMPTFGLMVLSFGGFWLCVWRRRWRLWGLVPIAAGFCSILLAHPPDLLVDGEARAVAARGADGSYYLTGLSHNSTFVTDTWVRRAASGPSPPWPERGPSVDGRLACAGDGCRYRVGSHLVLLRLSRGGPAECAGVELTLITEPTARGCDKVVNLTSVAIRGEGGYAIWLEPAAIEIVSARDWRGDRPWVPRSAEWPGPLSISAATPPAAPAP
jgi:competence protein ComEC